jgi:hypothetical protein
LFKFGSLSKDEKTTLYVIVGMGALAFLGIYYYYNYLSGTTSAPTQNVLDTPDALNQLASMSAMPDITDLAGGTSVVPTTQATITAPAGTTAAATAASNTAPGSGTATTPTSSYTDPLTGLSGPEGIYQAYTENELTHDQAIEMLQPYWTAAGITSVSQARSNYAADTPQSGTQNLPAADLNAYYMYLNSPINPIGEMAFEGPRLASIEAMDASNLLANPFPTGGPPTPITPPPASKAAARGFEPF